MDSSGQGARSPDSEAGEICLTHPDPRPFVKWAGGKGALVKAIVALLPKRLHGFRRYVEPFVGAGALFFWMRRSHPELPCLIADSNEELVNAYRALRDDAERVLQKLETHQAFHDREHYYRVRRANPRDPAERAARFIYLNRTCYNGLYRVNRSGEFNVPMGRYEKPRIADRENLLAVAGVLRDVDVRRSDFELVTEECGEGDFVYLDPPYHPISSTSAFTTYTREGFGAEEQRRLAAAFQELVRRGAAVILSNSCSDFVRDLYGALDPRPVIEEVSVSRAINSKATGRGSVPELLIHHVPD